MDTVTKSTLIARRFMKKLTTPHKVLTFVLLIIVFFLVVMPLFTLIRDTFTVSLVDSFRIPGLKMGSITLYHWNRMFTRGSVFIRPILNSLLVSSGTAIVAMVIGCTLAWLVTRTNVYNKKIIALLAITPYVLPSWALSLPWLEFFKNSSVGRPPGFLEYYTGYNAPEWLVFGPFPIILVMGLHYYPFVFMMVSASLKNIDSQIEEASELLGASRWRTLRLVTFPAVLPALLSALLLAFARTIGTYGTPALLGAPSGFTVLPVQIRSFQKMNLAAQAHILALLMIVISIILLFLNEKYIGSRKNFSLIGGKGFKSRLTNLGKLRPWFSFGALTFLCIFIIAPLLLLVWSSFMSASGSYGLDNFTLHYWIGKSDPSLASGEAGLFRNPMVWTSTINSLKLSLIGGLICATLGMFIGYAVVKGRGQKISKLLERISFIPMLVPSIAFGAIYLSLFSRRLGPIPALYGTFTLLVLLVIGKQLPFSTRSGISAMHQIGSELEDAAEITGASWSKRYRQIIWPLSRTGFISGLLIVFVTTMRELSLFILLISPRTQVLTTLTFSYSEIGIQQLSNALMSFLVIIVFIVTLLIKFYEKLTQNKQIR